MNPVFWGLTSALGFGVSDFLARLTSRALGPSNSLLGTLIFGLIGLSVALFTWGDIDIWKSEGWLTIIVSGIGLMVAPLMFYAALNRGPVSVAAPIGSSFPVFVVVGAVALGVVPTGVQWSAMAITMIGVWVVARFGREAMSKGILVRRSVTPTVLLALFASLIVAASVLCARDSVEIFGELESVWLIRIISILSLIFFMVCAKRSVRLPLRWWPVLSVQGLLEVGGFITVIIGMSGDGAALAAVGSAPFAVVTVILAWVFLKEKIPLKQWIGIFLVVVGAAMLAYVG